MKKFLTRGTAILFYFQDKTNTGFYEHSMLQNILKYKNEKIQQRLYFLFLLSLLVPNIFLAFTDLYSPLSKVINILLPACIYLLLLSLPKKPGIIVWILLPIFFLNSFELVLLNLFGASIIAVDMFLNLVTSNPGEASELLAGLIFIISIILLVYVSVFVLAVYSIKKMPIKGSFRRSIRQIGVLGLIGSWVLIGINKRQDINYKVSHEVFPINVCYNIYLAVERYGEMKHYQETSKDFVYSAQSTHGNQKEAYILVIGETSRACNWSLYGYEEETTPRLAGIRLDLFLFNDALSQSNTTFKSVPIMISPADAHHADKLPYVKSMITAYKEAGYHTVFYSNQANNNSYIDYFATEADDCLYFRERTFKSKNAYDLDMLPLLRDMLHAGHDKLFIILHTYGSHFNYRDRYTETHSYFKPDEVHSTSPKHKISILNAYNNTIRMTDDFIFQVIENLQKSYSICGLLYTSDHGEDIYDDVRIRFLHSSPTISYYQLHVPYLIWLSQAYREKYPKKVEATHNNTSKAIASNTVFHSMLDMSGIDTHARNDSLSVMNPLYTEFERCYLDDHNEGIPLKYMGLKDLDEKMFKRFKLKMY